MVFKALIQDVPMFNQQVYLSRDTVSPVGRIDEILGPVKNFYFTVSPANGINIESMTAGAKLYLDKAFILPLVIFTNPQKPSGPKRMGKQIGKPNFGNRGGNNFGQKKPGQFGNQQGQKFHGGNRGGGNFQKRF